MVKRKRTSGAGDGDKSLASAPGSSITKDVKGKAKVKSGVPAIPVAGRFLAFALSVPSPACASSTAQHYVYIRAHTSTAASEGGSKSERGLPADRTLFVVNLPVDTTEAHLRAIFSKAGPVESIRFQAVKGQSVQGAVAENDDGEVSVDEGSEEEQILELPTSTSEPASKKRRKGAVQKPQGPPPLVALPPLDPRIAVGSQPFLPTASSAHLVFLDASSVTKALDLVRSGDLRAAWPEPWRKLNKTAAELREAELRDDPTRAVGGKHRPRTAEETALSAPSAVTSAPPTGLAFLIARHSSLRPTLSHVKAYADSAVAHHAYLRAHPPPGRRPGARIPGVTIGPDGELLDADGFTIVQRGGKYGRAKGEQGRGVQVARRWGPKAADEGEGEGDGSKKKKSKELEDFYRFQLREKKREQLASLRANFEADKEKVRKLKESRRFKPF